MIFHCLRYWVHNYHVDGFRFDLASILSRNRDGELVPNPPLVESIGEDPLLADTKIIAEAWDAAGGYQVGTFGACAGPNGTAATATTCGASGGATRTWSACWPRGWPDRATSTRPAAGALSQHQLHHLARRLHAQRPGFLQREAQRGQRRRQSRRRQQQLQLQLRRRGPHPPHGRRDGPPAANQEPDGLAAAEPGRADGVGGRRVPPHRRPATTTPTARTTRSPGSTGNWSRSTSAWSGFARRWWPSAGPSPPCGRPTSCSVSRSSPADCPT
jgi:hypothetical protein